MWQKWCLTEVTLCLSVIMGIDSVEVAALCALACWLEFCGCHADHADLSLN